MARHWFGGDLTGWVFALGDVVTASSGASGPQALIQPGKTITFWSAQTAGTQYTQLLDGTGTAISSVTADVTTGQIPRFQGPDKTPEVFAMWADAGAGRVLMVCTDVGDVAGANAAAIADLQDAVASLQALFADSPLYVRRDKTSGAWPTRPSTSREVRWVDAPSLSPAAPTRGGQYMAADDFYEGPRVAS